MTDRGQIIPGLFTELVQSVGQAGDSPSARELRRQKGIARNLARKTVGTPAGLQQVADMALTHRVGDGNASSQAYVLVAYEHAGLTARRDVNGDPLRFFRRPS